MSLPSPPLYTSQPPPPPPPAFPCKWSFNIYKHPPFRTLLSTWGTTGAATPCLIKLPSVPNLPKEGRPAASFSAISKIVDYCWEVGGGTTDGLGFLWKTRLCAYGWCVAERRRRRNMYEVWRRGGFHFTEH